RRSVYRTAHFRFSDMEAMVAMHLDEENDCAFVAFIAKSDSELSTGLGEEYTPPTEIRPGLIFAQDHLTTTELDQALSARILPDPDTITYAEAIKSDEAGEWKAAINEELQNMEDNKVWMKAGRPLPKGKRALPCKWVLKRKRNSRNEVERYKARLVILGN